MEVIFRSVNIRLLNQDKKSSQEATVGNKGIFHTLLQSKTNKGPGAFQTEKKQRLLQKQKI